MVFLIERPPEGQNLPAAVAPSIGPVLPDQGVASDIGVFQAGLRSLGDISIPRPESISSQSPLDTGQDYRDAVDRMTGSLRDSGIDEETVSGIVHDMNALRDGDAEMVASFQKAADDIQNGDLKQEDRNLWEIIVDALKNITPEQRNYLLTDAGITYGAVAGFWLSRKYFDRLKLNPKKLQIAGLLLSAGSLACIIGGQVMATASQTAPAPDGSSPLPAPTSPDMTPSPASNVTAPAPDATPEVEPATPGSPDGYSPATLLGSKDAFNTVAETIDQSGHPITETANSKYIKAHKFSEADLQSIVDSGSPQYGITVDIAKNTLENMTLMKNLTTVNVPGSRVYYFYNGLSGNDSRGFMLLVSADGNSVWQAKNKATGELNHFPNTFSGIDLSKNFTPEQLAQFVRPWQPADAEPQETDRLITQVDISTIGGIDQLNVVFQPGTENAFLVGTTNQVKSGIDVVKSVFDSETQKWLVIEFSTPAPDPTVTPTSTETSTSTSTPAPTETQRPSKVVFQDDFESGVIVYNWGAGEWHTPLKVGGDYQIISDSTNSGRGNVLKLWTSGTPSQEGSLYWRHIYPNWMYRPDNNLPESPAIQVDIYIPNGFSNYIGVLSFHSLDPNSGKSDAAAGFEFDGQGLVLSSHDNYGYNKRVPLKSNLFNLGKWATIRLEVDDDGYLLPYINGELAYVSSNKDLWLKVIRGTFFDGHAGILVANSKERDVFTEGQWILNDNFLVTSTTK